MFHFLSYNQGRPGGELLFGNGGQHHIRAGRNEQGSKVKEGGGSLAFCLTGFLLSCGTLALRSEWNPCATSTVIFFKSGTPKKKVKRVPFILKPVSLLKHKVFWGYPRSTGKPNSHTGFQEL